MSTDDVAPLQLVSEPRTEVFEVMSPAGTVVVVTRNLDSGGETYEWTTRTELRADPGPN